MLGNLIPWKKQSGDLNTRYEEHPTTRFSREFDELWNRCLDDWRGGGLNFREDSPWLGRHLDFDETENEYVLRAELPGFESDEIDVKVSGNRLTLRAEHKEQGRAKNGNGSYQRYGSFYESFSLPNGVEADQIDARYHSGVLEVHLPKSELSQAKRIEVKTA